MRANYNFSGFPVGTKIQSYDKDGYYVGNACGYVEEQLGGGHVIIKTFEGEYFSTVSQYNIAEAEVLN